MGDGERRRWRDRGGGCGTGAGYFMGWIGALVYYMVNADGFWSVVLGVLKSFVWPAILVYSLLKSLAA